MYHLPIYLIYFAQLFFLQHKISAVLLKAKEFNFRTLELKMCFYYKFLVIAAKLYNKNKNNHNKCPSFLKLALLSITLALNAV
jgi:hypothetical protein